MRRSEIDCVLEICFNNIITKKKAGVTMPGSELDTEECDSELPGQAQQMENSNSFTEVIKFSFCNLKF